MPSSEHLDSIRKCFSRNGKNQHRRCAISQASGFTDKSLRALTTQSWQIFVCSALSNKEKADWFQEEDETLRLEDTNEFCRYRLDSYPVKARHSYKLLLRPWLRSYVASDRTKTRFNQRYRTERHIKPDATFGQLCCQPHKCPTSQVLSYRPCCERRWLRWLMNRPRDNRDFAPGPAGQ